MSVELLSLGYDPKLVFHTPAAPAFNPVCNVSIAN
jgi:hypothetical protein